jgi:hypothetical protein
MDAPQRSSRQRYGDPTAWWKFSVVAGIVATALIAALIWRVKSNAVIDAQNAAIVEHEAHRSVARVYVEVQPPFPPQTWGPQIAARLRAKCPQIQIESITATNVYTTLPVGERCIGKQLFRRIPNGWEQVTDCTASIFCG